MPEHAEKSAAAGLDGIGQPAGGKDREAQLSGESEQTENNRVGHTNGIRSDLADWRALPEEAREKNISRQPGEPERTAPAHHRQTRHLSPLCLKGHGITGGSVNGKGEGNRRREKPGETLYHRRNGTGEERPEGVQGTTWLL